MSDFSKYQNETLEVVLDQVKQQKKDLLRTIKDLKEENELLREEKIKLISKIDCLKDDITRLEGVYCEAEIIQNENKILKNRINNLNNAFIKLFFAVETYLKEGDIC